MKSTDNETVIKLSKFISLCFEKRSKYLEAMNALQQYDTSQQTAKAGRTRLPANEATFRYQSSFVNYFGGTPYT
jgi:hypothetical protein